MPKVETIKKKAEEVYNQGYNFVKGHKKGTIFISLAVIAVASLTAAYFLSPAYATFVGTVGTKAATLVSPAITAISAFAVAHPLIASLVVLAALAALITAPVLAYKNSNKASKFEEVKQDMSNALKKDSKGNVNLENNQVEIAEGNEPKGLLTRACVTPGIVPLQQPNQ
ncbi:hypothetical protein [Wolbachia endosymbiont (group A) of Limnophora tigrina]|uniref:hypothetical protein n=1 Tax=Wolbachia endosymbiont (group A) of Limnophora tigrina TaxID=3139318 RepID=UPI0035B4FF6F